MSSYLIEGSISESTVSDYPLPEGKIKYTKPPFLHHYPGSSLSSSSSSLSSLYPSAASPPLLHPGTPILGSLLLSAASDGPVLLCTLHLIVNLADLIITTTTLRNIIGIPTSVATYTSFVDFSSSLECPGSTTLDPTTSTSTTSTTTSSATTSTTTSTATTSTTTSTATTLTTTSTPTTSETSTSSITPTSTTTMTTTTTTTNNIAATAATAAAAVAVAVGLAAGVGVGVAQAQAAQAAAQAASQGNGPTLNQQAVQNVVNQVVGQGQALANAINPIPLNALPFFVLGVSVEDDSCGDGAAKGVGGDCVPVLKSGDCPSMEWLTVDPEDLTAKCGPRLCGSGRIFMASDGLCHDVYDARQECPGGRRMYYSAFGDPICDCPVGEYPFPTFNNTCVKLFTRASCPKGEIVRPDETGNLTCTQSQCPDAKKKPMAMADDGNCYQLGTRGPCNESQLFAYDIFLDDVVCDNVTDEKSPYFLSVEEQNELDKHYNQLYPYSEIYFWYPTFKQWLLKKQSEGIFQLPTFVPDPALAPCRPGARNGNNIKCTNPLLPRGDDRTGVRQAVRPITTCRPGQTLSARGDCRDSAEGASCGPSYEWNAALRRCTQSRDSLG